MSATTADPTQRLSLRELEDVLGPTYHLPQVDLLPPEVRERRRLRRTQRKLVVGLVVLAVLLLGAYLVTLQQRAAAADDLAGEQARASALVAEQAEYAEVPRIYAEVDTVREVLRTVMANDVPWYRYLGDIAATYPEGVWMTTLNASIDPLAAETAANPLGSGGIGSVTFTGTSRQRPQIADWLDVLDGTEGFASSSITSSTRTAVGEQPVIGFESAVTVTDDALSGRYETFEAEPGSTEPGIAGPGTTEPGIAGPGITEPSTSGKG